MHHYHHRAFYLGVLSVALIVVGLLALNFPVFLDAYDQFGFQIKCGTGFFANLTQAAEASGGDYVGQCETALMRAPSLDDPAGGGRLDPSRRHHLRGRHDLGPRVGVRRGRNGLT